MFLFFGGMTVSAKKIVVTDDEPHIRHVLALKLEKSGFIVHTAGDGQEALDLCAAGAARSAHYGLPDALS